MASADRAKDEEAATKTAPPKKKGALKWIIIGVAMVALIGVSVGASVYLTKNMMGGAEHAEGGKQDGKKQESKVPKVPVYYTFDPPFVVNFRAASGMRFLQVSLEAMTYDPTVVPVIEQSLPVIRNNLIFLLSNFSADDLATQEGKVKIRAQVLAEMQKVIKERTGKPGVEEVYFTSFVMQ